MAIQLQLRKGTKVQNDAFTGAEGELTYDSTTKGLRIHDGSTQGGIEIPTLVAVQHPTADNDYTWYRKWSDGWVEQGGWFLGTASGVAKTITLPIEMIDTNYSGYGIALCDNASDSGNANSFRTTFIPTSTTQITLSQTTGWRTSWQVSGMAAE